MKHQTRVYIAGPYSADNVMDVLGNMRRGIEMGARVLLAGFAPFVPWLDDRLVTNCYGEHLNIDDMYRYSMSWLEASDAVLVLPGESEGVKREASRAMELGLPIFTDFDRLCDGMPRLTADLVPEKGMVEVHKALMIGAAKHGDDDYRGRYDSMDEAIENELGSIRRHLDKYANGSRKDKDDGHHHLAAVATRCLILLQLEAEIGG